MAGAYETHPVGDAPIGGVDEDRLGRDRLAQALARQVVSARRENGFVLGVDGAWGSGKTSLLTLLKAHLRDEDLAIDFNPWLYSDKNELVMRFLAQVRAQLPDDGKDGKYQAAKKALSRFQGALGPLAALGTLHPAFLLVGTAASVVDKVRAGARATDEAAGTPQPDTSAEDERDAVKAALAQLPGRLVVFIDDVDRLAPTEVAEMMRVIKLVGDFPNVSYVVAFDRRHVERALETVHGGSGRAFLEKVIQATQEVPYVPEHQLAEMLRNDVATALDSEEYPSPLRSPRWPEVETDVIAPLLTTVRDVRRLTNVLPTALALTGADVDPVDVAALEAIRLAEPNLHGGLVEAAPALTRAITREYEMLTLKDIQDHDRAAVTRFVTRASEARHAVANNVVLHLFPGAAFYLAGEPVARMATDRWLDERRVASLPSLLTYLSKAVGRDSVGAALTDEAAQLLTSPSEFERLTEALSTSQLHDLLKRIRLRLDKLDPETAPMAFASLSNVQARLPYDGRGRMDPFLGGLLFPVAHDLRASLQKVHDDEQAAAAFDATTSLSAQYRFIQFVSDDDVAPGEGRVFSEGAIEHMKTKHRQAVLAATGTVIAHEQAFFELINLLIDDEDSGRTRLGTLIGEADLFRRVLAGYAPPVLWNDGNGTQRRLERDDLHVLADIVGHDAFTVAARSTSDSLGPGQWDALDTERLRRALALVDNGFVNPNAGTTDEMPSPPTQGQSR